MNISPGLITKVHSIYTSAPDRILSQLELLKSTNVIKYSPGITAVFTVNIPKLVNNKINKLLVSLNERLSNIILEKTIEYNTTQPENSTAKESNATSEIESTWKERPKFTWPTHELTCSSQVITCLSYGTNLLAVTIVSNYAVT